MKKILFLISAHILLLLTFSSCEQKDAKPTGGFGSYTPDTDCSGFEGDCDPTKGPDYLNLYLTGYYMGTMTSFHPTKGYNNSQDIKLYINATGLDPHGWNTGGDVQISIEGPFTDYFNINSDECIRFGDNYTNQVVEYWMEADGTKGANISLEFTGLGDSIQARTGTDGCTLYGHPVRLSLRLIFLDNNEGEPGPVHNMEGSYILYYANVQRAYLRENNIRAENPSFCCWQDEIPPDWQSHCDKEITLDARQDLSYFSGRIKTLTVISTPRPCHMPQ